MHHASDYCIQCNAGTCKPNMIRDVMLEELSAETWHLAI